MAGTVTISGSKSGLATGADTIGPVTVTGTTVIGTIIDATPVSGDNTYTIPTGAVGVLITPPSSNGVALKVRYNTNSGDAGTPIDRVNSSFLAFDRSALPTTLYINAGSNTSGTFELNFI